MRSKRHIGQKKTKDIKYIKQSVQEVDHGRSAFAEGKTI